MRFVLLIAAFSLGGMTVNPQTVNKETQIEKVQTAVINLASRGGKAEFLRSDFAVIKGSIAEISEDNFRLKTKPRYAKKGSITIAYKDVLAMSSKNGAISFIPDPNLRGFGGWDDVLKIDYYRDLEVALDSGEIFAGRLTERTKDAIVLENESVGKKTSLPRDRIVSVFRVWREYDGAGEGALSGARKGKNIGNAVGVTPEGRLLSMIIGTSIGTAIGLVVGASRKEARLRLLVYSK